MPALTITDQLSSLDDSSFLSPRNSPNPYPRPSPSRPPRSSLDAAYIHPHFDSGRSSPYHERVHSPSLPPQFTAPPPSSAVFTHLALSQSSNWQPHVQIAHNNPYPPPQAPQLLHKVWILDCMSCGTFLTNRGMKAVLLLRPNVSLFSTDALPVNCSAYSTNPDALRPPPCRPSAAPYPPRTCECLTQTLCCHTCGAAVGYMIVVPCFRCTSSISATNRATNGHRFVFHSSEIIASERHHILDEPGVLPLEYPSPPPPPPSSPPPLTPAYPAIFHSTDVAAYRRPGTPASSQAFHPPQSSSPSPEFRPSPQMESSDLDYSSAFSSPDLPSSVPPTSPRRSPRPLQTTFPHNSAHIVSETRGLTPEYFPRKLKAGDILYWHHLSKHGEIPGVEEDPRARLSIRGDPLKFCER